MHQKAPGRVLVAMEGTGSYGAKFCDLLTQAGMQVAETRPPRRESRREGKSDDIDAEQAARHTLPLLTDRLITPRARTGAQAALRVLLTARHGMKKARSAAVNRLTALLRIHDLGIDARTDLSAAQITNIAKWRARAHDDAVTETIRGEAIREAREIKLRDRELTDNEKGLTKHVKTLGAWLLDENQVGPYVAAQLLVAWSTKGRIHSEAAFARLGGIAPIPASSGNTNRHRLHRGGDRELNSALWTTARGRYYMDAGTAAYAAKRQADGKSDKEIIRCLKRYIARSLFRKMEHHMP
jgi:transposase